MRLISPGKMGIALDGREILSVILISKFLQQHQPQRAHEKPDFTIPGISDEEWVWTMRSIFLRKEMISMDSSLEQIAIKLTGRILIYKIEGYTGIKLVAVTHNTGIREPNLQTNFLTLN